MAQEGRGGKIFKNLKSNDNNLFAVIGDEDTVTGFLLAGAGDLARGGSNFLVVDSKTPYSQLEDAFKSFTSRNDIAVVLINQHIAHDLRHLIQQYDQPVPTILEIPSKDHPYDVAKDPLMQRINRFFEYSG